MQQLVFSKGHTGEHLEAMLFKSLLQPFCLTRCGGGH